MGLIGNTSGFTGRFGAWKAVQLVRKLVDLGLWSGEDRQNGGMDGTPGFRTSGGTQWVDDWAWRKKVWNDTIVMYLSE